jgi:hypothetical protein
MFHAKNQASYQIFPFLSPFPAETKLGNLLIGTTLIFVMNSPMVGSY